MADDLAQASSVAETASSAPVPETAEEALQHEQQAEQAQAGETVLEDEEAQLRKEPQELLDEGNASLALARYAEAAELFSIAVEKLTTIHGEMAVETVDALELYGNALLRNAIAQSAVLGAPSTAAKPPSTNEASAVASPAPAASASVSTSTSTPVASGSASKATPEPLTAKNINFHFGGDDPDEEEDDEDGDSEGEEGAGGAGEEPDDLETAFEILDTARAILTKPSEQASTRARQLQLARIHSSMAEVETESGRPANGVREYEAALAIQGALLPAHDRLLAQTHMFIGLAYEIVPSTTDNQVDAQGEVQKRTIDCFEKAVAHVEHAKAILVKRRKFLNGVEDAADGKGKGKAADESASLSTGGSKELSEKDKEELKDIAELIGDLDGKIEDLKAQVEDAKTTGVQPLAEQLKEKASSLPEGVSREVHTLQAKKKKKPAVEDASGANGTTEENGKRKAVEEKGVEDEQTGKKVKLDV